MSKSHTWIKLACGVAVLSMFASSASAARMALRAVKKNGVAITPTSTITGAAVGDEYECEIRIFNFAAEFNNLMPNPGVRSYQAGLELSVGSISGPNDEGLILPKGWNAPYPIVPCGNNGAPDDSLCAAEFNTTCSPSTLICVRAGHNPALGASLNINRTDFIHSTVDFGTSNIADINRTGLDYIFFSTIFASEGRVDAGIEYYGGTVILVVQQFACGTYTFGFRSADSLLVDVSNEFAVTPQFTPLTISLPACPPVKQVSNPPDCIVDARRPHPLTATTPREGIQQVVFSFDSSPAGFTPANFAVRGVPLAAGSPPTITSVSPSGNNLTINLSKVLNTNQWTCIRHIATNTENCFGNLPGDVDQSTVTQPADAQALVMALGTPTTPLWVCDQDQSGRCGPLDLITEMDLLNGAASFIVWNNAIINNVGGCPSD